MTYRVMFACLDGREIELTGNCVTLVEACQRAANLGCDHVIVFTSTDDRFWMWQDPECERVWEGTDPEGNDIIIKLRKVY